MSREEILNELQKVQYPGLDKSIIDLKIVEDVNIDNEKPVITLSMQNDEAYNILESHLNDLFNEDVVVKRKALTQKNLLIMEILQILTTAHHMQNVSLL